MTKQQILIKQLIKNLKLQMKYNQLFLKYLKNTKRHDKAHRHNGGVSTDKTLQLETITFVQIPSCIKEDIELGLNLGLLSIHSYSEIGRLISNPSQFRMNDKYKKLIQILK